MKATKIGLLNKGNLTNYLLWLGRCEHPHECFWIPERNAWCGGLRLRLSGEDSWVPAQGLHGADFMDQNTPESCKVVAVFWCSGISKNVCSGGKLHRHLVCF